MEISALYNPIVKGLNFITNEVVLFPVIVDEGTTKTVNSGLPVIVTNGVPVKFRFIVPKFSIVYVRVITELIFVILKSVLSNNEGVMSPSVIIVLLPLMFINGTFAVALIAKV